LSRPGRLVVISGPSGVGKTSLISRLVKHGNCRLAVSATTRRMRPGEVDGVDYRFLDRPGFESLRDRGLLLESAEVHDQLYGTQKSEVAPWLDRNWTVILDVDSQGFRAVRKQMPVLGIFVMPPSKEELIARLRGRKSEDAASIACRIANAEAEMNAAPEYDRVVVNDDLDRATREVESILGFEPVANKKAN
jgi:guanylate kinase